MTVTYKKTDTEIALAEEFDRVGTKLPGGRAVAAVRREAMARFRERGLPHRRIEEWKYTDLRAALKTPLALSVADDSHVALKDLNAALGPIGSLDAHRVTFVNGHHRPDLSSRIDAPKLSVILLSAALQGMADADATRMLKPVGPEGDSLVSLNTALSTDGAIVSVGGEVDKPILIIHAEAGPAGHRVLRNTIGLLSGAKATVVEVFVRLDGAVPGQVNTATEVAIGAGAELTHVRLAAGAGTHLASTAPTIEAGASYRLFQYVEGSALVRAQVFPLFAGEGAKLDLSGVMLCRDHEHVDTTFVIDHAVPGCESRELIKAVLDGSSRAVCQGKVIVRPDAQKTDGKQMAQALMLSERAEFDSKPELEIYADDVVCGHGSTVAEIDPQQLFYLRARGIPKDEARAMLIDSFVGEAIETIAHTGVREALHTMAQAWLRR